MFKLIFFALFSIFCSSFAKVNNGLVPMLDGRIVGGKDVSIEQYPHQISMRHMMMHRCGGSIISDNMILSAAHCVDGIYFQMFMRIRAGVTIKSNSGIDLKVLKIYVHENYHATTVDNDIALLILKNSFEFSPSIQPIALPKFEEEISVGTSSFVTGWGATSEGGFSSRHLKAVEVQIIGETECSHAYNKENIKITQNMICAGQPGGGHDACQGDSGGPMVVFNKTGNSTLIGIVSWGYGCARPAYPGVYAKVSQLRNWIEEKIRLIKNESQHV